MNRFRPLSRFAIIVAFAVALAAGCSSGGGDAAASTTVTEPIPTTAPVFSTTTLAATTTQQQFDRDPVNVETNAGPVRGVLHEGEAATESLVSFLAVPYAAPPLGDRRWQSPAPPEPWTEPYLADAPGLACPQNEGITNTFLVTPESTEDCLTLDVVAPADAENLPVMVWIHGGGFTSGSAHQPLFEGSNLARRGVVTVAINYRLGPLGFLVTDQLTTGDGPVGNWGIQDQVLALQWVRDNIAGFGGDPANVTIFGESAGGFSVCTHLALSASAGLFHQAIIQSGAGCDGAVTMQEATGDGTAFVNNTPCADSEDQLGCLRALPVDALLEAAVDFDVSSLVLDGFWFTESAMTQAVAGTLRSVPIITGSNLDESTLFTLGDEEPTDEALPDLIAEQLPDSADLGTILSLYANQPTNLVAWQTFLTDLTFACPAKRFADAASAAAPIWLYQLTHRSVDEPFGLGATHGAELIYLFGNPSGVLGLAEEFNDDDAALSEAIMTSWVAFATNGDPGEDWPAHSPFSPTIRQLEPEPQLVDSLRQGRCTDLEAAGAFSLQ